MEKQKLFGIGLLLAAVIILFVMFAGSSSGGFFGGSSTGEERAFCTGTIDVRTGMKEQISAVSCDISSCGLFAKSFLDFDIDDLVLFGLLDQEGSVHVVAGDTVVASELWDATLGGDVDFSMKTGCFPEGSSLTIKVYDEKGNFQDDEVGR
jgi:hypothetical protein